MKKNTLAHLALFTVALIYGGNYSVAKIAMASGYIPPLGFIFCRVMVGVIFFWLIHFFFIREKVERSDFPRLFLCGVFGVALNQIFFFKGLELTTPIHASLIMLSTPFIVIIAAYFILREQITKFKVLGIVLGSLGAMLLILKNSQSQYAPENLLLGDIFIVINAASYGIYLVIVKPLMTKYNPVTIITWVFTMGSIVVFPVCFSEFQEIQWEYFNAKLIGAFIYVIVLATLSVYLLNTFALTKLKSTTVSAYIYLQPFVAGAISLLLGQDMMTTTIIFAGVLIFSGLYLVSLNRKSTH